ncbi:MAG TPA: DoxX family protein [bacterium]|nr:DoxX family protein [bacterium]
MEKLVGWFMQVPAQTPKSVILIRLMTGWVFFWEGVIKFVFVNQGVGRFTKLGIPFPEYSAHFVGCLEIIGGLLLIFGFLTRWICVPFIIQMTVAILTTKVSMFLGTSPLPLPPVPPQTGFWAVLHEGRSDLAQILCSSFLLVTGAGALSLDWILWGDKKTVPPRRG